MYHRRYYRQGKCNVESTKRACQVNTDVAENTVTEMKDLHLIVPFL